MNELAVIGEWDQYLEATGRSVETRRGYRYGVLRFLTESKIAGLGEVAEDDVTRFLASVGPHSSARAIYFRGLRSFFTWAAERDYIGKDPTKLLKVRTPAKPPVVALSPEELYAVFCAAWERSPRRAWALCLCYALGTRRSELVGIRPEDCEAESVFLRVTKGDRPRRVPVGDLAQAAIEGLRPWYNGTILGGVRPQTITHWAQDAARDAGLPRPKRKAHVLRATFATRLLNEGTPISVVSNLLGHQDVSVTTRYLSTTEAQGREAVSRL